MNDRWPFIVAVIFLAVLFAALLAFAFVIALQNHTGVEFDWRPPLLTQDQYDLFHKEGTR